MNLFFAMLGLPLMYAITSYTGEINLLYDVFINPETKNWWLGLQVLISGASGILITNTSLLTVTVCGPLAINISGTLKDVMLTYLGFIFFDDVTATPAVVLGLGFSFLGATYYSYSKYLEATKPKEKVK